MTLKGQTALVTGGAVRIGRSLCETLADAGASVLIAYRESATEAKALEQDLRSRGGTAWAIASNLDTETGCIELMERAIQTAGPLDILINNAAQFRKGRFDTMTEADLLAEFRVNLFAPLLLAGALARQNRPGQVVHLLDRRVTSTDAERVPYVLSKKALAEATRMAALAFAPRIRVNAVAPGAVLPPAAEGPDYLKEKAGFIPLQRFSPPRDVAEAVLFLLTSPSLTGQILYVDGGQSLTGCESA
jgi:NAD(P)-dependent dehydrogenase (short-subunit alcohol dehydrogenase family)